MSTVTLPGSVAEENCLKEFKKWLQAHEKDLVGFEWMLNDRFYLHFVRGKKYDEQKAVSCLLNYFKTRKIKYKELFRSLDPLSQPIIKNGILRVLKNRDNVGRPYIIGRFPLWTQDLEHITGDDMCKALVFLTEEMWNCPHAEIHGGIVLVDVAGFNWHHFKIFHPVQVFRIISVVWNNMPLRYHKVHLVHTGYFFGMAFNAAKPLMPKKLQERIILHPDDCWAQLHGEVSPKILPKSFGGHLTDDEAFDVEFENRIFDKHDYYKRFTISL